MRKYDVCELLDINDRRLRGERLSDEEHQALVRELAWCDEHDNLEGWQFLARMAEILRTQVGKEKPACPANDKESVGASVGGRGKAAIANGPAEKEPSSRPANGEEFVGAPADGKAKLTIVNGTAEDAVVMLHHGAEAKRAIYVRAGATATMEKLEHSFFWVTFESGHGWDPEQRAFTRDVTDRDFLSVLDFTEKREGNTIAWHDHRLTLHSVPNGNAPTRPALHRPTIPRDVIVEGR